MGREGPETKLIKKMRDAGTAEYGDRLVSVKYHGSQFGESGVSDTLSVLDGVFVAIEVKSPEASAHKRKTVEASIAHALEFGPTVKQRLFVARVLKAGGCGGFAATVEQYMEILDCAAERDGGYGGCGLVCGGHNV